MFTMKRNKYQESCGSNWSVSSRDKDDKMSEGEIDIDTNHDCQLELQSEHEAFLSAFQKPTQIYRFLRTRQLISPIFLHRSLTYMKHKITKNRRNNKRKNFKVDSLLESAIAKKNSETEAENSCGNLCIRFTGIQVDSPLEIDKMFVEVLILKLCHKKRKDVFAPVMQLSVGQVELKVNPKAGESVESKTITIPKSNFSSNSDLVKSYSLLLHAYYPHSDDCTHNDISSNALQENITIENNEGQLSKKRRLQEDVSYFKAELVIFDKFQRCLLIDADYEIVLQEYTPPKGSNNSLYRNKKTSWESCVYYDHEDNSLDQNSNQDNIKDVFRKGPILSFQLSWNRNLTHNNNNNNSNNNNNKLAEIPKPSMTNSFFDWCEKIKSKSKSPDLNGNYDEKNDNNIKVNNKNCISELSNPKKPQRIIYQFLFNNNTRQQTKPRCDYHCPWCSLNCNNLYSLLKHLKLCHSRFTFTYVPHTKGARIDVAINESFDGSYAGNPHDLSLSNTGFAFSRNGPVRRTPVTHIIVCHPRRYTPSLSEFLEPDDDDGPIGRTCIVGHNRLYYHSTTCLPIRPQEMEYDSEAENDPEWMKTKTQMMIDEFTDVNEGEKEVMKLWNLHVMKHGYVGDCQIPLACMMFVEEKGIEVLSRNLYRNFILHLCNLFDFGLLNASSMIEITRKLHHLRQKFSSEKIIKKEPKDDKEDLKGDKKQIKQESNDFKNELNEQF